MGVPQMIVTIAANQAPIAASIHAADIGIHAGAHPGVSAGEIARRVEALLGDTAFRSQASARGQELVDGQGALRVAELLA